MLPPLTPKTGFFPLLGKREERCGLLGGLWEGAAHRVLKEGAYKGGAGEGRGRPGLPGTNSSQPCRPESPQFLLI